MALTDREIQKLKVGKRTEVADRSLRHRKPRRGLVLLANPKGDHTWLYQRMVDGERVKKTLGTYPDLSLAKAREMVDDINEHDDGPRAALDEMFAPKVEEAGQGALTVQNLISSYMDACSHNRDWQNQKKVLDRELKPYLDLPASELTTDHVVDMVQACLDRGKPRSAQEILKQVKAMYNWGLGQKRDSKRKLAKGEVTKVQVKRAQPGITFNPAVGIGVPKYQAETFHFESADLLKFLPKLAASNVRDDVKLILGIQLQTFCRVGEVAGMRWDEVNLRKRQWTIPGERYKKRQTPHDPSVEPDY